MGSPRVSPAEIIEMHRLFAVYGTYTAVGNELGRHPSTVAKYIKMEGVPSNICLAVGNILQKG